MNTIQVQASGDYNIHIGSRLLGSLGAYAAEAVSGRSATIVSDENVWALYGKETRDSLEAADFHICSFVISPGESNKNTDNFLGILNFLAENHIQRTDCLIALGGGVVGDLGGFAAACYLRGIPYIQVPTSLLAMVDSSVGGKTAIDLPAGKNLCGAFWQPKLVLCDPDCLDTLPTENFREACAEIIKYGILFDADLFAHLEERGLAFDREAVISRCVELKAHVVQADELDFGARRLLNLGHTLGHAIEAESGYAISHGNAVAMGIAAATTASEKMQLLDHSSCSRILSLLKKFGLPTSADYSGEALLRHMLHDKKAQADRISVILPHAIGHCEILPMKADIFLKAGL